MERMRVFNNYLGDHYAIVNIPDFKLLLFEKDSILFETRVVVGKSATSTPILRTLYSMWSSDLRGQYRKVSLKKK